ncbi:MAG: DUF4258 domain-containing protein [Armatimonadetes bacterium]|nr:DUF4258 domain-containing protein [Armatimonadota bacterium]
MRYRLSIHAEEEMARRGIAWTVVEQVLAAPEQVVGAPRDRRCYPSRVASPDGQFLVRVGVVDRMDPALVVMVYRTSRVAKYWKQP